MSWINTLKISLASFFLFIVLVYPVSAKTSQEIERTVRDAWEVNDCKQAKISLEEMRKHLSQATYYFYLAEALEFGNCVDKNVDEAIANYKKSFNMSQSLGAMNVGMLYLKERRDPETAQKWFRVMAVMYGPEEKGALESEDRYRISEAVKNLFVRAPFGDREFPEKEFREALIWAVDLKTSDAKRIYEQAIVFEKGLDGYPASKNAFSKLLHRSVMLGYPPAAWRKAQQLLLEKRPLSHALSALKVAAHGGMVDAQVQVGRTYRDINKNKRYLERAYEWFIFARKNGANIKNEIKTLESRIDPEKIIKIRKSIEVAGRVPK